MFQISLALWRQLAAFCGRDRHGFSLDSGRARHNEKTANDNVDERIVKANPIKNVGIIVLKRRSGSKSGRKNPRSQSPVHFESTFLKGACRHSQTTYMYGISRMWLPSRVWQGLTV